MEKLGTTRQGLYNVLTQKSLEFPSMLEVVLAFRTYYASKVDSYPEIEETLKIPQLLRMVGDT